jgi:small nuclear ribonucleoprotein (snRNP)-like protein
MYENILKANLGKVVTVKTTAGIELIATLTGYDEKKFTLTLDKPRLVVITEDEVAVVPYTFTSKSEEVLILREQYLSVDSALENSSTDYLELVKLQS